MSNPDSTINILTVTPVSGQPSTVALTYNAGTNPPLNNNGNVKETVGQGQATITYTSTAAGWTVCGYTVSGTKPTDMTIGVQNGNLVITDSAKDAQQMGFRIQVTKDGGKTVYTSQDPTLVNEPPK